jgi:hypothetical protein
MHWKLQDVIKEIRHWCTSLKISRKQQFGETWQIKKYYLCEVFMTNIECSKLILHLNSNVRIHQYDNRVER